MSTLFRSVRLAARSLNRRPGFAALVVSTIAIGVGSSAAVFATVNGVLLRPLPFANPDDLIMIWSHRTSATPTRAWVSQPDIESLREGSFAFAVEGVLPTEVALTGTETPEYVPGTLATGGLMLVLGVSPQAGRDLWHSDNDPDAPRVVVVSHDFWQSRLGGRPNVVGTSIQLWEEPHEIVGVAPPAFEYPPDSHLWLPRRLNTDQCGRGCPVYRGAVARVVEGASRQAAQIEASAIAARTSSTFPDAEFPDKDFWLESLLDYEVGDVRRGLWITFGVVGLILLIVCINVTNLLLVRGAARTSELTVRTSLGASRRHLALHVLAEVALLTAGGGVLGLLFALGALGWIQAIGADQIPRMTGVAPDASTFAFLLGVMSLVTLAVGLLPALRFSRSDHEGRLRPRLRGATTRWGRTRAAVLAAEVALSVVALVGAGLLVRSLGELNQVDLGFDREGVTRFSLVPPLPRYPDHSDRVELFARIETAIGGLPGVERVGSVFGAPLTRDGLWVQATADGSDQPEAYYHFRPATVAYFDTMGISLLRGPGFPNADVEPVAVIDEHAARSMFGPVEDPIGRSMTMTSILGTRSLRIVGLVPTIRGGPRQDLLPAIYPFYPALGFGPGGLTFHVKAGPGATDLLPAIRAEISRIDSRLILLRPGTVTAAFRAATSRTRFFTAVLLTASAIAVVLVGIGLYGVVAFVVAQSTSEIGLRMALGATPAGVTKLFVMRGLGPTLLGLAVGLATAALGGHTMDALLFGITSRDPVVLAVATLVVLLCAIVAISVPARRAAKVAPLSSLGVN